LFTEGEDRWPVDVPDQPARAFVQAASEAGWATAVTFPRFQRHICATLLLSRNVHPKYVQELLGHANIVITLDAYSHVMSGMGIHVARALEDALS